MSAIYPASEPYDHGWLDVGDGHRVYWETCGQPAGKPALVVHGGPGSGCTPWQRRLFDPERYRIVLFDQRGCGRSTPHAGQPVVDLSANTTPHLLDDMERLRQHLGIERWLLLGGSWGSTLALAYAERYPAHTSELILFGVTTGRREEFDWTFRGAGLAWLFPVQWDRLLRGLPPDLREGDVVEGYARLLQDPDPRVHQPAAEAWCRWESASPAWPPTEEEMAPRFTDPDYRLAFARIVTHYVRHNGWIDGGSLLPGTDALAGSPGVLVHGRYDLQAPLANAWLLAQRWPRADLVVINEAGHTPEAQVTAALIAASDRFAAGS